MRGKSQQAGIVFEEVTMAMFSTSVLLQQDKADGTTKTSHTLHWIEASDHDEAIAAAVTNA